VQVIQYHFSYRDGSSNKKRGHTGVKEKTNKKTKIDLNNNNEQYKETEKKTQTNALNLLQSYNDEGGDELKEKNEPSLISDDPSINQGICFKLV